ncbi:hypothetical protein [Pontibacter beigongshangensis]|uniref:hypothetical protein n=1 Tax=Pontibacter beigongshangensis TaxID=2574733 RepID=UPI001650172B|nr:hypothetical protein [Pontibacter beigongshangensis]
MAELLGDIQLSTNANPKVASTFDVRHYVSTYDKLLTSFTEDDKLPGVWFVLCDDPDPDKKGFYFLNDRANLSSADSWLKVSFGNTTSVVVPESPAGVDWKDGAKPNILLLHQEGMTTAEVYNNTTATAIWNTTEVKYAGGLSYTVNLPSGTDQQFLIVAARQDGTFVMKFGSAGQNPDRPTLLSTELWAAEFLLTNKGAVVDLSSIEGRIKSLEYNKQPAYVYPTDFAFLGLPSKDNGMYIVGWLNNLTAKIKAAGSAVLTANLWEYLGLATAATTITTKGWLDFLTGKVKANEENKLDKTAVKQALGESTADVMSQKAVSDLARSHRWRIAFTNTAKSRKIICDEAIAITAVALHNIASVQYQLIVGSTLYTQRAVLGAADNPAVGTINHDIRNLSAADKSNYTLDIVIALSAGQGTGELLVKYKTI